MLEVIKRIDKRREFFRHTKNETILKHKKK